MSPSDNHRTPIKVFAGPFSKGRRFSGQRPESLAAASETPLLIPVFRPESTKKRIKKRDPHVAKAHKKPSLRTVFSLCVVRLKPGSDTGFQKGDSGLCGVRSGHRPENPQPLKRLAKLLFRPRGGIGSTLNPETPDQTADAPQYKPKSPRRCPQSPTSQY